MKLSSVVSVALPFFVLALVDTAGRAEMLAPEYCNVVDKGLEWLAKNQHRDGHWEGQRGEYATAITSLAAMALLMEGSTIRGGAYADNISRAVDYVMHRCQRNGLIGNVNEPNEDRLYMFSHGFGLLFLASVYGEEDDGDRRHALENILTRAVEFTGKAQTPRGGWGYITSSDGHGFDEGAVTVTQVQALRAARNVGIVVPGTILDKADKYLKDSTTPRGGVIYSLSQGQVSAGAERPALTVAAIAAILSAREFDAPLTKRWLKFCETAIPIGAAARSGNDEYMQYYYAQVVYRLGDGGFEKLFPESKPAERLTWSQYRKANFDSLVRSQGGDGSWTEGSNGPVYATAIRLTILQLDKGTLPIYQR